MQEGQPREPGAPPTPAARCEAEGKRQQPVLVPQPEGKRLPAPKDAYDDVYGSLGLKPPADSRYRVEALDGVGGLVRGLDGGLVPADGMGVKQIADIGGKVVEWYGGIVAARKVRGSARDQHITEGMADVHASMMGTLRQLRDLLADPPTGPNVRMEERVLSLGPLGVVTFEVPTTRPPPPELTLPPLPAELLGFRCPPTDVSTLRPFRGLPSGQE